MEEEKSAKGGSASGGKKGNKQKLPQAKEMREGLAVIYGDHAAEDFSTLEKAPSRTTQILIRVVVSLAAAAVLAYAVFFLVRHFATPSSASPLELSIVAPSEIVSGESATLTVHYKNTLRVPIASLSIDVNVPEALSVTAQEPAATEPAEYIWNLGAIPARGEGDLMLSGNWLAAVPSSSTFQALATYRPANFNADFSAVASVPVTTTKSGLAITAQGPEKVAPGETAEYQFVVSNTSQTLFAGARVSATLPKGFLISSSDPVLPAGGAAVWEIGDVAPAASINIALRGTYAADVVDIQQMKATVLVAQTQTPATFLAQAEASTFSDVLGNGLRLNLVGNGVVGDLTLSPGDDLRLTLGYGNTEEDALKNAKFVLDFTALEGDVPIVWKEATLDGGTIAQDGIRWEIATLEPGTESSKNTIFPLKETLADSDAEEFTVTVHATVGTMTVSTQPVTVRVNADVVFTAESRYFDADGAPLGEGPLPPNVGETTSYGLVWTLSAGRHPLKDVRMSATLPAHVTWLSRATATFGTVVYDDATRTISWSMVDMPEDTGTITANIPVSITPGASDEGTFVKLLSATAWRATDSTTGASLQGTNDALTTECPTDPGVEGKGTVIE